MTALALVSLLAAVTPNPIQIHPDETAVITVDVGPGGFVHGAGFGAEDKAVAMVRGGLLPNQSRGEITVLGLIPGRTRLMLEYIAGMSLWRVPMAEIVVVCEVPTVALSLQHVRIGEDVPVTVSAMTTGWNPVHVEWYEGDRFRGRGSPFTFRGLSRGVHRFTARAGNQCGAAFSEPLVIEVAPPRRRSTRR